MSIGCAKRPCRGSNLGLLLDLSHRGGSAEPIICRGAQRIAVTGVPLDEQHLVECGPHGRKARLTPVRAPSSAPANQPAKAKAANPRE